MRTCLISLPTAALSVAATDQGLRLRERFARRLRADAGPVKTLTESQLRELRNFLVRAMAN